MNSFGIYTETLFLKSPKIMMRQKRKAILIINTILGMTKTSDIL